MMAGSIKHHFRKIALHEYGKERPNCSLSFKEIMIFINTYKNQSGKTHRHVNTNSQVIGNLMRAMPEYKMIKKGYWIYTPMNENKKEEE